METDVEAVVIGAGAAGLAAAVSIRAGGIDVVVLERDERAGASWDRRYDGVRLNTVRWMSGLPGMGIPRSAGRWPSRDAFADYLRTYAVRHGIDLRSRVEVERIDRSEGGWRVATTAGPIQARYVVVATGYDHAPHMPDWPGRAQFAGELIHGSDYRNAARFRGREVLVVGAGNTGVEVAAELARGGARSVRVSMRTPPNLLTREMFGLPATPSAWLMERLPDRVADLAGLALQRRLWGDLARHGIPRAPYGIATELRRKHLGPVVDSGFVELVKARRIEIVPALERFEAADVVLTGDIRVRPDAVIAATGYKHGLEPLVGHLGVLLPDGRPAVNGGRTHPAAPGLYFNGYRLPLRGQLPYMGKTSRRIGRAVALDRARMAGAPRRCPRRVSAKGAVAA